MRTVAVLALGLFLSGCEFYSLVPRPIIKSVGNVSIVNAATVIATDKTIADHVVSYRSGKDCSSVRSEQGRSYCREDEPNPIADVTCYQTLGDVMCYAAPDPRHPGDSIDNLKPGAVNSGAL